jgi:hypothetical protein
LQGCQGAAFCETKPHFIKRLSLAVLVEMEESTLAISHSSGRKKTFMLYIYSLVCVIYIGLPTEKPPILHSYVKLPKNKGKNGAKMEPR